MPSAGVASVQHHAPVVGAHAFPSPRPYAENPDGMALGVRLALDQLLPALARAARPLVAGQHWSYFGYARAEDYAREVLHRSGRWLRDRATLGEALHRLPALALAIDGGDGHRPVGQAAAMSIARVATAATVPDWIDLARRVTVRRLKQEVRAALADGRDTPWETGCTPGAGACSGAAPGEPACETEPTPTEPDEDDSPCRVSIWAPGVARALFEDALDLHRAVSGHQASPASFVEAMLGEAMSGSLPGADEFEIRTPAVGVRESYWRRMEEDVFVNTGCWSHLPGEPQGENVAPLAILSRARALMARAGQGGPADLQVQMLQLLDLEERLQKQLGDLLMLIGHERGFRAMEFTGLEHYAEQRLGLSRTSAFDRVTVARAGLARPALAQAYASGHIGLESALLLVRLFRREDSGMTSEDEADWIRHAGEITVKRLRDELRLADRRVLAAGALGPASARLPGDQEWYASIRLAPGDTRARLRSHGPQADLGRTSILSLTLPRSQAQEFLAALEARRRLLNWAADPVRTDSTDAARDPDDLAAAFPSGSVALQLARRLTTDGESLPLWVGLLSLIEDYVEIWDDPRGMPRRPGEKIYIRDGWRCAAPGCTSRRNLESHHVVYRSHGGELKAEENQVCLCRFHHQQGEHGGLAEVRGRAPLGLVWRLGDRSVSTWYSCERHLHLDAP